MITYITVHGTGDGERPETGGERQWWRQDSAFCTELLVKAPTGSRVEPFLWSGANDERDRHEAALRLMRRLDQATANGEEVHPIGHSHGGSVIALALRYATARGHDFPTLEAFTTVGSPFLEFRLKPLGWERFGSFGQALLGFLGVSALVAIATVASHLLGRIWPHVIAVGEWVAGQYLVVGAPVFSAFCLVGLYFLARPRRGLFGKRARARFASAHLPLWRGLYSQHDEAIAGLARAPMLKVNIFSRRVLSTAIATVGLTYFMTVIAIWWLPWVMPPVEGIDSIDRTSIFSPIGTPYSQGFSYPHHHAFAYRILGPIFAPMVHAHALLIEAIDSIWIGGGPLRQSVLRIVPSPLANLSVGALFSLSLFASYLATLTLWLQALRLMSERVVGPFLAFALNTAARAALVRNAFGGQHVREDPVSAMTSPFGPDVSAQLLPETIDTQLMDFAVAHIGETYRRLHLSIFDPSASGADSASLADAAVRQMTWNELVHTAYFKVPDCRAHLIEHITARAA